MKRSINILSTLVKEPPSGRIFQYSTELQEGLPVYEVEESWLPFIKLVDDKVIKDEEWESVVLADRKKWEARQKLEEEILELDKWFIEYYDKQTIQFERSKRLGEPFDKDMEQLDLEAKVKSARIKELREQLKEVE